MNRKVQQLEELHRSVEKAYAIDVKRYNIARVTAQEYAEALSTIQTIAQTLQQEAHKRISQVATRCLAAIFDEPYELEVRFDRKRSRTEAMLLLKRDGLTLESPLDATGGGVIDVAAFALRLAGLLLTLPEQRRLLVLDEPFRFLSAEYRPRVVQLLKCLESEFSVQILMITHMEDLQCGKVIEL